MSSYTQELKGLNMLYHMMTRFNMTYADAIDEMERHNQDMTFIVDLGIDKEYIIKNKEVKWWVIKNMTNLMKSLK